MRFYLFAGILLLAGSACTDSLVGPDVATEPVLGAAAFAIASRPECIHLPPGGFPTLEHLFHCNRGEPDAPGAPPDVYLDGENLTGG